MEPLLLWRWIFLLLIPGSAMAGGRIEINTAIYAHYAITTIKAPFVTGNVSKDVTFEMELPRQALISGFSITTDGLECKATVENITTVNDLFNSGVLDRITSGKVRQKSFDEYISNIITTLSVKKNTHGFFLLTFEHQVVKDEIHNHFNVKIGKIGTSEFYKNWSVIMDITGYHRIDTVMPEMEMFHSYYFDDEYVKTDISEKLKQNVYNLQPRNSKRVLFGGSLTTPDPEFEDNSYTGSFSVTYNTDPKKRQMEVFVSETQISAIISENSKLNANPARDIVVLIDTSGSMGKDINFGYDINLDANYTDSKLDISLTAVTSTFLRGNNGLKEEDRVTFIRFYTNVEDLGTYNGGMRFRIEGKRALLNISADGLTDINGAIHAALNVTDKHILENSKDIPLIVIYTDGKPEGGRATGIETDKTKIIESIKNRNKRCIPIYSIAIGGDAELDFLTNISQDNCGVAYEFGVDVSLEDNLSEIFEKVRVPIYSSKPKISINSDCVKENTVINDLTKLSGTIFSKSGSLLIDIPLKTSIRSKQTCEVEIIYRSIVANKEVEEKRKICLPKNWQAGSKYVIYKNSLKMCPNESIEGKANEVSSKTFLDHLREYKDISEKVKTLLETFPNRQLLYKSIAEQSLNSSFGIESLIKRAKKAGFVVKGLTGLVVVARGDNGQCKKIPTIDSGDFDADRRPVNKLIEISHDQYTCKLRACNKSRFRGKCIYIYDEKLSDTNRNHESQEPFVISSLEITEGGKGNCSGYILYTEENYAGYNKNFKPGNYTGFRELGIFFQETRSLKATSITAED